MRTTLRELAKMCGCSVPSASRALKDDPNISGELKTKVHEAAKELGYIPDSIATSMCTGQTKTIAIILQDLMNPYFSIIANKMERCASDRGMDSIIITTDYSSRRELKAVYTALGKNVDGVLFLPVQKNTEAMDALNKFGAPFVLVHRFSKTFSPIASGQTTAWAHILWSAILLKKTIEKYCSSIRSIIFPAPACAKKDIGRRCAKQDCG